ncbi:hypothetical protein [Fimbriiglobus ruber]|uniref:Uncharacterized protein n=1 Tax=Fimbriiglobus ruber TaxID=1908690 RepID=A0A225D4C5_9BACT|nr:hypothetical protein [Fimbriiglobus ruber]OWK34494.1 hypothetical protein FRUB_10465 [Fimbriiglobus ruber]
MGTEGATWAVEAWAHAIGRPPGYRPKARRIDPKPAGQPARHRALRWVMGLIAAAGGGLGGFLGAGAFFMVMFLAGIAVDAGFGIKHKGSKDLALFIFLTVIMLAGGIVAAPAAFLGWMMGRGDEKPWSGFAAAFGSAAGTAAISYYVFGPTIISIVGIAMSTFGATYRTASRGGNDR